MAILRRTRELYWTRHARNKMQYYALSEGRVRRILHSPKRIEEGIAPGTIAFMQRGGTKRPYELWVMVQDTELRRKVISAWRYPGITKERQPLPADVVRGLQSAIAEAENE
jgi:hypothetical protein